MDAGVADVDADGDLDIVVASEFRPDILLLNDGEGRFTDGSDRLPRTEHDSEDVGIADFDGDGDLDIVTGNSDVDLSQRRIAPALIRAYLNDGRGHFTEATHRVFGEGTTGTGLDLEFGDFNGDGLEDMFLASRGTADRLLLSVR
jgi:hypothetical protein